MKVKQLLKYLPIVIAIIGIILVITSLTKAVLSPSVVVDEDEGRVCEAAATSC